MYASPIYCSRVTSLLNGRNTRYGWVASPYPTGTLTRQDTPSFLGAIEFAPLQIQNSPFGLKHWICDRFASLRMVS